MIPSFITDRGCLLTESENTQISTIEVSIQADNVTTLTVSSGQLPPGLSVSLFSTNIVRITGTTSDIDLDTTYYFTLRLTNNLGFSEREYSIKVTTLPLSWIDPTNLGTVTSLSEYEYQFLVSNSSSTSTFMKISGTLPTGLSLSSIGRLYGTLDNLSTNTTFTFTIRCTSNDSIIDREFSLIVTVYDGNTAPVWITSSGSLGNLNQYNSSDYKIKAYSTNGYDITYSMISGTLPPGLSFEMDGNITGQVTTTLTTVYTFTVRAISNTYSITRTFTISTNVNVDSSISWTTDSNLGTIGTGDISTLSIIATSNQGTILYTFKSGSLPNGLKFNTSDGTIIGTVLLQTPNTYTFTIQADNGVMTDERTFTLTVISLCTTDYITVSIPISRRFYKEWNNMLCDISETSIASIYRSADSNFGIKQYPTIKLVNNLRYTDSSIIKSTLLANEDLTFYVGGLDGAVARDSDGTIIYDVIYRKIIDPSSVTSNSVVMNNNTTFKPATITSLRNRLLTIGTDGDEKLPLWMTCLQTISDTSSVIGYIPCIEIAYLTPGTKESILPTLQTMEEENKRLYKVKIKTNRIDIKTLSNTISTVDFFNY